MHHGEEIGQNKDKIKINKNGIWPKHQPVNVVKLWLWLGNKNKYQNVLN